MKFKIRGGKLWKIFFWWDYTIPFYFMHNHWKLYSFFKIKLRRWRYKRIIENHIWYEKDRLLFWKEKKDTGVRIL